MKKIHVLLSKKSWEELEEIKKKIGLEKPTSYKDYLEEQKINPTMAWCG